VDRKVSFRELTFVRVGLVLRLLRHYGEGVVGLVYAQSESGYGVWYSGVEWYHRVECYNSGIYDSRGCQPPYRMSEMFRHFLVTLGDWVSTLQSDLEIGHPQPAHCFLRCLSLVLTGSTPRASDGYFYTSN
jgi:hypothetical protein